jgi:Spy/CpxP family protein refolding chaperone
MTDMFNNVPERTIVMKPWLKKTFIGIFGASILIGGLSACSHGYRGNWSEDRVTEVRGKVVDRISSKLDLNDVQKQKLAVLADELIAQRTAFRGPGADPRADFKALIAGEKFDRTRAQTLLEQKTQAVQGNAPKVIAALADFYDSLNPAQQKQVRDRLEQRHGGWGRG